MFGKMRNSAASVYRSLHLPFRPALQMAFPAPTNRPRAFRYPAWFRFPCRGCCRFRKFAAGPTVQPVLGHRAEPASEYAVAASAASRTSDAGSLAACCRNGAHWTESSARESMTLGASRDPRSLPRSRNGPLDYSVTSNHRCGRAFLASVERHRRSAGSRGYNAHAVTGTAANMADRQKPAHASPRRSHNCHRRELKVHRMTASHVHVTEARGLSPTSASRSPACVVTLSEEDELSVGGGPA